MKKDTFKTKVLFLLEPKEGENQPPETFAYFPNKYHNKHMDDKVFMCYAHIGQHSACHQDYANECKEATKEQAADLMAELESIGYNLQILNKW